MARKSPEIILTDREGALLEVEALAYPEDKNLIVDPYAVLEEQQASMDELIAGAEATLPRPLGEIIPAQAKGLSATWLYRLVLLDFDKQPHCRAETVEETLRQLICQVASLKVHRLGLDRFELLEPCISSYRVMFCLYDQVTKLGAAASSPPTTELTFCDFAHAYLVEFLCYCAITVMSIFMTLVIVILMIFFDTLVEIKKLKNCNMNEKKISRAHRQTQN